MKYRSKGNTRLNCRALLHRTLPMLLVFSMLLSNISFAAGAADGGLYSGSTQIATPSDYTEGGTDVPENRDGGEESSETGAAETGTGEERSAEDAPVQDADPAAITEEEGAEPTGEGTVIAVEDGAVSEGKNPAELLGEEAIPEPETAAEAVLELEVVSPALLEEAQSLSFSMLNPVYEDVVDASVLDIAVSGGKKKARKAAADPVSCTTQEDAALIFREKMKVREVNMSVQLDGVPYPGEDVDEENFTAFIREILDITYEETGDPAEGDYLRYGVIGYNMLIEGYRLVDGELSGKLTLTMRYAHDAAQEEAVTERLDEVMAGLALDGLSDYEIISRINEYICDNTVYDYDHLRDDTYLLKHSAYSALIQGKTVCQGYAVLFYRMMRMAGLDCRVVSGIGNRDKHAWNLVRLGYYWYWMDVTWNDSSGNAWFLKGNDTFDRHTPEADRFTDEFFEEHPVSDTDYDPAEDLVEAVTVTFVAPAWGRLHDPLTGREGDQITRSYPIGGTIWDKPLPIVAGEVHYWDDGWYRDAEFQDYYNWEELAGDITLYLNARQYYVATLHGNGGVFYDDNDTYHEPFTLDREDLLFINNNLPKRADAVFDGWYEDAACTIAADLSALPAGDIDLYAGWTTDFVTIHFVTEAGTLYDSSTDQSGQDIVKRVKTGTGFQNFEHPWIEGDGYYLMGWSTDADSLEGIDEESYLCTQDQTFYAVIRQELNVTFHANGGSFYIDGARTDEAPLTLAYWTNLRDYTLPEPVDDERAFDGWYYDAACTTRVDLDSHPKGSAVDIYAGWTDDSVLVTFIGVNGELHDSLSNTTGKSVTRNVKRGSIFDSIPKPEGIDHSYVSGWYKDKNLNNWVNWDETVSRDTSFYADVHQQFEITYHANGGTFGTGDEDVRVINIDQNFTITQSLSTPQRDGMAFVGWYYDEACLQPVGKEDHADGDIHIYAGWTSDFITLTFVEEGGQLFDYDLELYSVDTIARKFQKGIRFADVRVPDCYAYIEGWYTDAAKTQRISSEDVFSGNTMVYARIIEDIAVRLHGNGGYFAGDPEQTGHVETWWASAWYTRLEEMYLPTPSSDTAVFTEWYYDAACTRPADMSSRPFEDLDLYAGWSDDVVKVTFIYPDGELIDDITGNSVSSVTRVVKRGASLNEINTPYVDGHYWTRGWYTDREYTKRVSWNRTLTEDMTLYLKAERYVRIQLEANGGFFGRDENDTWMADFSMGTSVDEVMRSLGSNLPHREDAVFDRWYFDEACTRPVADGQTFTEDVTLYAGWEEDCVIVTFKAFTDSIIDWTTGARGLEITKPYKKGSKLSDQAFPRYGSYAEPMKGDGPLQGWYLDAAFTREADPEMTVTSDLTVYAWILRPYTITLHGNGGFLGRDGEEEDPTIRTYIVREGDQIIPEDRPTRSGYAFDGWYYDAACTRKLDYTKVAAEDLDLYAGWSTDIITVTFHSDQGNLTWQKSSDQVLSGNDIEVTYRKGDPLSVQSLPYLSDGGHTVWYTDASLKAGTQVSVETAVTSDWTLYADRQYTSTELRRIIGETMYPAMHDDETILVGETLEARIEESELPDGYTITECRWSFSTDILELTEESKTGAKVKGISPGSTRLRAYLTVQNPRGYTVSFNVYTSIYVQLPDDTPYQLVFKPNYTGATSPDYKIDTTTSYESYLPTAEEAGFARSGYRFVGWSREAKTTYQDVENLEFPDYGIGTVHSANEVITFYAVWGPEDYIPLQWFDQDDYYYEMEKGEARQIELYYEPADATLLKGFTYLSDNPSVVTVDKNGLVTAVGYGEAYIDILYDAGYDEETGTWNARITGEGIDVVVYPPDKGGWVWENSHWRYYEDGRAVTADWRDKDGDLRYLGADGNMTRNSRIEYAGESYYVDRDGIMVTNCWVMLGENKWIYADYNGHLVKSRVYTVSWKKYLFDDDGYVVYGGFVNDRLQRLTGQDAVLSAAYYCGNNPDPEDYSDDYLRTGWLEYIDGVTDKAYEGRETLWFYFDPDTAKKVTDGTRTIEGVDYTFDKKGVLFEEAFVTLDHTDLTLEIGKTKQLKAQLTPESASDKVVTWTSDDPSVVTVDDKGVVTAVKVGTATITVKTRSGDHTATCKVNVIFKDVPYTGVYYSVPVYWAADQGITMGYTSGVNAGKFGVGMDCQRKDLMIFLWRYAGCPTGYGDARKMFKDLGSYGASTAANQAIAWAYKSGITKGYSDGGFHPTDPIARKDVMIMLYRMEGKPSVSGTLSFSDCQKYNKNSDTYKAILWGSKNKITNGYTSGKYKGQFGDTLECLREQIVTFLYRYDKL